MACRVQPTRKVRQTCPFTFVRYAMSITSVSNTSSTDNSWWLEAIKSRTSDQTQDISQTMSSQDAASVKLSPMGQFMSKLESLASSDPDKFKEVTSQISDKLKTAASKLTGQDAEMLTKMADRFAKASETGDMSALKPPKPPDADQDQSASSTSTTSTASTTGTAAAHGHHHHGRPSEEVRNALDGIFNDASSSL